MAAVLVLSALCTALPEAAQAPIGQRLANADPQRGAALFNQCRVCHTVQPNEAHKIGPNLWGVVGRDVAAAPGFEYSDALEALPGSWDYPALDAFLSDPAGYAPGTRMGLPGMSNAHDRAAVIAYLRTLSDSPVPPPEAATAAAADEAAPDGAGEDPFGEDWPEGPGREQAGYLCNTCHSLAIVKQQGLSRDSWDDLLEWMVDEQGMPEPSSTDRELILDYLAENFGVDRAP